MPVDISSWPTKTDVCQTLGLSLSQINNLIKLKRLEVRREKRFGAPPIGKVNPKDVAREKGMREARDTETHVMPKGVSTMVAKFSAPASFEPAAFAELLGAAIAKAITPPIEPAPTAREDKDLLTIKEAVRRGYTRPWLKEHAGELMVGRKISRFVLERMAGRQ